MNRLNKILLSFILPFFCLLISVSYAGWSEIPNTTQAQSESLGEADTIAGYTLNQIRGFFKSDVSDRNKMLEAVKSAGYYVLWVPIKNDLSSYYTYVFPISSSVDFGGYTDGLDTSTFYFFTYIEEGYQFYVRNNITSSKASKRTCTRSGHIVIGGTNGFKATTFNTLIAEDPLKFGNLPYLKKLSYNSGYYWDGTSYYWENSEPEQPDEPATMPTNAEIASAVQMFYNSVYNLPNIGFKDFVVLYDNTTGLYTYIGHNRDNSLGQVIVEPNGYYEGYKFDVQWWKFYLENSEDEWWFENIDGYFSYFVYTSDGTIENLNYVGKSNISGLIEKSGPWATAKTVIVYSTNDYPVKYVTFPDDSPDPDIQTGTIQGDQYTYDENLDITDNQYNPLDNFISINYPSTLVGNADFDSFLNTFNENKDVLILPQNANWVILANNSLFSHFSSFIIMCTLFIILQRVMRG